MGKGWGGGSKSSFSAIFHKTTQMFCVELELKMLLSSALKFSLIAIFLLLIISTNFSQDWTFPLFTRNLCGHKFVSDFVYAAKMTHCRFFGDKIISHMKNENKNNRKSPKLQPMIKFETSSNFRKICPFNAVTDVKLKSWKLSKSRKLAVDHSSTENHLREILPTLNFPKTYWTIYFQQLPSIFAIICIREIQRKF
jgi:hypothetical protein